MLPFLQVTSPILKDSDFDPLVHVGKVCLSFLDSSGGETSSMSYAYDTEPELSKTRRFTNNYYKEKIDVVVGEQNVVHYYCEYTAKVDMFIKGKSALIYVDEVDEQEGEELEEEEGNKGGTLMSLVEKYKANDTVNIAQTLAGMLSISSVQTVENLRDRKFIEKVVSFRGCLQ